ncbi:MAG: hypothetical protein EXR35_03345 [Limnohabitans sp.]|nr:hypothetical protein [Limnohabitans sp.]
MQEFVSYASQRPGKVSAGYGSSSSQVSIAVLNKLAKIDTMMVPYKGIPLAVNDVLAGVVEFSFVDQGNAMAQSKCAELCFTNIHQHLYSPYKSYSYGHFTLPNAIALHQKLR